MHQEMWFPWQIAEVGCDPDKYAVQRRFSVGSNPTVAELGASRMEETIGRASLRDAAIGTGVAVDKMLALTGQAPSLQIANIWMPSEEEREERRAIDVKLDAIARRLADADAQTPSE